MRGRLIDWGNKPKPVAFGKSDKFVSLGSLNAGCPVVLFDARACLFGTNFGHKHCDFVVNV